MLSVYVIYRSPVDYPGTHVIRRFEVWSSGGHTASDAKEIVAIGETLESVRRHLPPNLYRIGRDRSDHPSVMETWI